MAEWSNEHRATYPLVEGQKVKIDNEVIFKMPAGKQGSVAFDIMEKENEKVKKQ